MRLPVASPPMVGFSILGRLATPNLSNEAESGSLSLRLASSPPEASPEWITPTHARLATCQTGNLHGGHLSIR